MLKRITQLAIIVGMTTGGASLAQAAQRTCNEETTTRAAAPAESRAADAPKDSFPDLQLAIDRDIARAQAAFASVWNDLAFPSLWNPFSTEPSRAQKVAMESGNATVAPFSEIWFADPPARAVQISTRKDGGNVVMAVHVPGVDPKAVDVAIEGNHLRVRYDVKNVDVQKDSNGKVISRSQSEQRMVESVPLPAQVNPTKASIKTKADEVLIELPRKV